MSERIIFNGINGASGGYLLETTEEELEAVARGYSLSEDEREHLKARADSATEFGISPEYDARDLSQAGWCMIFPSTASKENVDAILEALDELVRHRREQAGEWFHIYRGSEGFRPGDTKDEFVRRKGASVGPVDPTIIPYYVLIVADPVSIPYRFQYELDVDYAVGRIYFETLEEYAHYARSVVVAETSEKVALPRKATFFSVANPDDSSTTLSDSMLIRPLEKEMAELIEKRKMEWATEVVLPEEATKTRLASLLGGDETPALLFTASHGLGWPSEHKKQLPFQGALVCQDWPGPLEWGSAELSRDFYFGAEDIGSDASLHGLVAFHFACYGAGTPETDEFAVARGTRQRTIAPRPFLSALPRRLLSHPAGGALAVIGHVERAWSYSFKWGEVANQTGVFRAVLYMLLFDAPVGYAVDQLNNRYASIATMLSNELEEAQAAPEKYDRRKTTFLWTANNDARGYAVIGDPAARIPVAKKGEDGAGREALAPIEVVSGPLPPVLAEPEPETEQPDGTSQQPRQPVGQPGRAFTVLDGLAMMSRAQAAQEESFGVGDKVSDVANSLSAALTNLADKLKQFSEDVTSLTVETYVSDEVGRVKPEDPANSGAIRRASTHIAFDGDMKVVVPREAGQLDESLWAIHTEMVSQAQANRAEMIRIVTEALTSLISPISR